MMLTDDASTIDKTGSVLESIEIPHAYASLFCTNTYPSLGVRTHIQSLIDQHERELAVIQDHAAHLRARLADLECRQMYTEDALAQLSATIAPIKRLPPEILSEIFEHCLEAKNPDVLFPETSRSMEAPLLLGRVCRSWRAIVHATPRLWQDVFLNVCDGRYSDELCADALPVLETWLAHSGSLPLRLIVLCKTEEVLPGLVDLFETIAAHAARWKMVHVRLQNEPAIYNLISRTFSQCPALSTFDLTDGGQSVTYFGDRQPANVQPISFDLSFAPLCQLSLSLAGLTIRDVRAPWATLTHLSFMQDARTSTTSITDYMAILRQCTVLKECAIAIDSGIRDVPLKPLTHPHLECLSLQLLREASQTTQTGDFLNVVHAPRLCTLSIDDQCPRRDEVLYYSELKTFLRTHAETLRHLQYSTGSKFFTSDDMIALIAETPGLVELEYRPDEDSSPRPLLEVLTPRMQGDTVECLLPCLERIFVYLDTTETMTTLGDMIEGRYAMQERGIARLTHLSCRPVRLSIVYDCMPPDLLVDNLSVRLEALCRCGLQVDWEAYRYDLEFSYC